MALPAHYPWGFDTLGHLGLIYLDTLLFVVEQEGKGACHTGERSCFYRTLPAEVTAR